MRGHQTGCIKEIAESRVENARVENDGISKQGLQRISLARLQINPHLLLLGFCRFTTNVQSGALTCAA